VANGSSVPACPTFVPRGSALRASATRSCELRPAGFARSRTPDGAALFEERGEIPATYPSACAPATCRQALEHHRDR
jgi:hypothetical protein